MRDNQSWARERGRDMAIQIGAKPDSGFDDPLGMLKDCHRRIENFLGILCVVVEHAQGRNLTGEERDTVQAALQYFRSGGQRHTADEEESLFPRLRAFAPGSFEEIGRLEGDHREASELHESVEHLYSAWITSGVLGPDDILQLLSETGRLKQSIAIIFRLRKRLCLPMRLRCWTVELSRL